MLFTSTNMFSQNLISVPFTNGFVGDNTANNVSSNSKYLTALGWSNVQFSQNSPTLQFIELAQGNDIPGTVLITDFLGIQYSIPGFIKWRTPSGNNITTPVFVPTTGATLATNSSNGSANYSITTNSYIGLTYNGQTLTIPNTSSGGTTAGDVTGNAATSGILDSLNSYLGSFSAISIIDYTVNEGAGTATVTVTLSASSANVITVAYTTSDGSTAVGLDYTATSGTITFAAGQTTRTFTIPIINDATIESNETINITLSDPTNASILDGAGVVTIVDNDTCTVGTPAGSVTVQPTCATTTGTIVFTTQSGVEYSIDGTTYQSSATFTGVAAGTYTIKVRSTTDNTCTATGSAVTVNAVPSAPSTPAASVTVQPTCATTTGTIVFTTQSGVEYSIDGTTYQSSATFTGVAAGTYTIKVRSTTDNTCTATGATVTVNAVPSAPSTPAASVTVQPTCATTTGTIVFTTQSGVEYSIDGTTYQSSATFTGVAAGTYTIKVRSTTDNTCTATGATVTVSAVPSAPSSPIVSQTTICGDITNISSYVTVSSGHTINITSTRNNTPTISNVNAPDGQTLSTGIYTIGQSFTPLSSYDLSAVSFYATNANSSATLTVKIYSGNGSAGPLLATKSISNTVLGEIIFNLNNPVQLTQNQIYTFIVETNTSFSHTISWNNNGNPYSGGSYWRYGSNFSTSDIWFKIYKVASYQISQINTISSCESSAVTVTIIPSPSAGTLSGNQSVCFGSTTTFSSTVSGGAWTSSDITVATVNPSNGIITGVAAGTATITYTVTGTGGCADITATRTVTVTAPSTPAASVTVQPTCATTTGTIVFTTQSGVEYSIDGTTYQSSATFTGVAAGTYTIKVRSTTDNTCTATGSAVTVNAVPSAPSTPAGSVTVQPTCVTTTGTIVFTTQSGVEYSIDGTTYQSSATFTGFAAGTYTLKVRSTTDNTCTATGATVTVNAVPSAPSTPAASVTVQPTCATTTGTIVFTTQSGVEYSIDGTTYQSSATFTGVTAGSYTIKVRSTTDNTCTATGAAVMLYDPICAITDTLGPINGYTGATTSSVLANDTLNGVIVIPSQVILTGLTVPTGLTLNADGTITIAPQTPAGTYNVIYRICETLNLTNCDTVTSTVIVGGCLDFAINDCDNDGETNGTENTNGTDPNNPCSYTNAPATSSAAYATWSVLDCDGDGTPNGLDTNPQDPCVFVAGSIPVVSNPIWANADCDNDGETNGTENTNGTDPNNPCSYTNAPATSSAAYATWSVLDCDGDGVINGTELADGTDVNNPCESINAHATALPSTSFLAGDCDGDGLSNEEEIGENPNVPNDSNGNGIPDYLEINNHNISDDDLEIFNAVTPNGNGDNDIFVIQNIQNYPNNTVTIFNRWGVVVYEIEGYGQNGKYFKGVSEGRITINKNEGLPIGTYFYVLRYVNNQGVSKERSGYLYLNK